MKPHQLDTAAPVHACHVAIGGLALVALAAACYGDDASPGGSTGSTPLPCAVDSVLEQSCRTCHAAQPRFGAPMPLVTWEDTQAPARSDPSVAVWQMMQRRVHDVARPMPASRPLGEDALATLDGWFAGSATSGESSCSEPPREPAPPPVQPPTTCARTVRFGAHGDGPGRTYRVPLEPVDSFRCFGFPADFGGSAQAAAFLPAVGDERVVHHYILFTTSTRPADSFDCPQMTGDATFLTGWAPGGTGMVMPDDVGVELPGPDQWLILQIHYNNTAGYTDAFDDSGVDVCTLDVPRPNTAAVYKFGSTDIDVAPRAVNHEVVSDCTIPERAGEVHVLQSAPHMHRMGTSFTASVLRGGRDGATETILDVQRWDFNTQETHATPVVVHGGDVVRTVCRYTNPGTTPVRFGEGTDSEMCFNFVLAYPAAPPGSRTCVTSRSR